MGQSRCLGSDSTKDFCNRISGAKSDEGRSCAGTPEGPVDQRSRSALRLPASVQCTLGCLVKTCMNRTVNRRNGRKSGVKHYDVSLSESIAE